MESCGDINCMGHKHNNLTVRVFEKRQFTMASLIPSSSHLSPPIAEKRDHAVIFGAVPGQNRGSRPFKSQRTRNDPWFWLRDDDRKSEEVLAHLRKENEYGKQELAGLEGLRTTLYEEHISHLKETDDRAACRKGGFFYYTRTVKGQSYKLHCRKPTRGDERVPGVGDLGVAQVAMARDQRASSWTALMDALRVRPYDVGVQSLVQGWLETSATRDQRRQVADVLRESGDRLRAFGSGAGAALASISTALA